MVRSVSSPSASLGREGEGFSPYLPSGKVFTENFSTGPTYEDCLKMLDLKAFSSQEFTAKRVLAYGREE